MFVDKATVVVKAGDGGDGALSFRHEKFIEKGGPDGGDGGRGGNVVFRASRNQNTLAAFRYQKRVEAESGEPGFKRKKHGKSGEDLVVDIPVGTTLFDETGELLADFTADGQEAIIAQGGSGGYGNAHFVSSTRQAPRIAEKGEPGDEMELQLELRTIADVGLVGLPNAGKSTLLASISNAHPEIANYPFTTIRPNLGVVEVDKKNSLLVADIPGLIEGASQGKGLGDDFLRHVERTQVLVHLIDAYSQDIAADYKTIQDELKAYKVDLTARPQIVVINKIDGLDADIIEDRLKELAAALPKGTPLMAISAVSKQNVSELLFKLNDMVRAERAKLAAEASDDAHLPVLRLPERPDKWHIKQTEEGWLVTGRKIERFAARTDFSNHHAEARFRDIMKKMGIMRELHRQGIEAGAKIFIGKPAITQLDY
jgi:GTP-binding protein